MICKGPESRFIYSIWAIFAIAITTYVILTGDETDFLVYLLTSTV